MQSTELFSILSEATSKLESLNSLIREKETTDGQISKIVECLSPVVCAVDLIRRETDATAVLFGACKVTFTQFLHLLRAALLASLEDPDLLRDLKERLEHGPMPKSKSANVTLKDDLPDVSFLRTDEGGESSSSKVQFALSACGHLTLSISNLWPEDAANALKFRVICIMETMSGSLQKVELDFIHRLLYSVEPPFFDWIKPACAMDLPQLTDIEKVVMTSLQQSDDFTRAAMVSQRTQVESVRGQSEKNERLRKNLQWLEATYPSGVFKVSRSSTYDFVLFCASNTPNYPLLLHPPLPGYRRRV